MAHKTFECLGAVDYVVLSGRILRKLGAEHFVKCGTAAGAVQLTPGSRRLLADSRKLAVPIVNLIQDESADAAE